MNLGGPRPWQPLATGAVVEGAGLAAAGGVGLLLPLPAFGASLGYLGGAAVILAYWRDVGWCRQPGDSRSGGGDQLGDRTAPQALLGRLREGGLLAMVVVGTCCLVLDGVDGTVARARGETSSFGARFDMETDAALLLALCLAVPALGVAGWWVLAIGGLRYGYVLAGWIAPRRLRTASADPAAVPLLPQGRRRDPGRHPAGRPRVGADRGRGRRTGAALDPAGRLPGAAGLVVRS